MPIQTQLKDTLPTRPVHHDSLHSAVFVPIIDVEPTTVELIWFPTKEHPLVSKLAGFARGVADPG